ncbi:MAG TPA: hypothetical protein V6D10_16170 [Trichocoleus sp.]|jgi:hypothetical protein
MNKRSVALMMGLATVTWMGCTPTGQAQTNNYYAGQSVDGRSVNVDLSSISRASERSMNFVYYLGNERVEAQANCTAGTWTTFPERQAHRPQSQATQNMVDEVCSRLTSNTPSSNRAVVFAPPSNVRVSPNGEVLCAVRSRTTIDTYGSIGDWYYTNVCGQMGVIHSSQIRF